MHAEVPLIGWDRPMGEALLEISRKGFGVVGVTDDAGLLAGIVTDGDLRRHLSGDLLSAKVDDVMTRNPKVTRPDALLGRVIATLNVASITALFVVDEGRPVGVVHVHDLLRAGVA